MTEREISPPRDIVAMRRMLHAEPELGFCEIITADVAWRVLSRLGWSCSEPADLVGEAAERLVGAEILESAVRRAADAGSPGAVSIDSREAEQASPQSFGDLVRGPASASASIWMPFRFSSRRLHPTGRRGTASPLLHRASCTPAGTMVMSRSHFGWRQGLAAEPDFPGTIRLILQPAEEGVRGAGPMVDAGVCDGVDVLLAIHLGFGVPSGAVAEATGLLATTKYRVEFTGRAAHAARDPEKGRNALLAAADATLRLHGLAAADEEVRVNVGALRADGVPNIIPPKAVLLAEIRAFDAVRHSRLEQDARAAIEHASTAHGVQAEVAEIGRAETSTNDPDVFAALVRAAAAEGIPSVGERLFGASDDASLMMNRVRQDGGRALYAVFGSGDHGPHHSPEFDIDESVLEPAARALEQTIRSGQLDASRPPL